MKMSAKTSAQPGRRTPLSLSGATQKQQQQQQQQQQLQKTAAEKSSNNKNENRTNVGNQKTEQVAQEKDNKKQQNMDKNKQQQIAKANVAVVLTGTSKKSEKNEAAVLTGSSNKSEKQEDKKAQNGIGNSNGNAKEKSQNGKEVSNTNQTGKDKKEKVEKVEKPQVNADKKEKSGGEKEPKVQEKEVAEKKPEKEPAVQRVTGDSVEKKKQPTLDSEQMKVVSREEKSQTPTTPTTKKASTKESTPSKQQNVVGNSTQTKVVESTSSPTKSSMTTTIDDVEMEPLLVDPSPKKPVSVEGESAAATQNVNPTATSTPGKLFRRKDVVSESKSEVKLPPQTGGTSPDRKSCPRTFSQISGRRGIRPVTDYTPSQFQSNLQFRESYRRINTELDVTSTTNTSLNVTVGSEVPNNSSFSFFGRGRKRDRTPPNSQSAMELQGDLEISPKSPKRARIDMQGFFSAVSSPLSLLRSRFSKTSIQSSTPVKLRSKLSAEDEGEVQNVSGISIEEEMHNGTGGEEATATEDVTVGNEAAEVVQKKSSMDTSENMVTDVDAAAADEVKQTVNLDKYGAEKAVQGLVENTDDIKVTETLNKGSSAVGGDPMAKNKRCSVM